MKQHDIKYRRVLQTVANQSMHAVCMLHIKAFKFRFLKIIAVAEIKTAKYVAIILPLHNQEVCMSGSQNV